MTAARHDIPRAAWLLCAAAALVFLPGIAGPFVLDDGVNLAPVWSWLQGQRDFADTVFGNRSGPGGRPLAYLTLMANAALDARSTVGFKLVNVALHAGNTLLVFLLVQRVFVLAPRHAVPRHAALWVAAAWALHPLHASTVLYVVQRMALLGAMAQFAAVLVWLEARTTPDARRARLLAFLAFPALVAAGALAKETALLAPLLCAVLELTLFATAARRRELRGFFLVFLVLPLLVGAAWLALHPERITNGYAGREFTLAQRLLSQPSVLLEQAGRWAWPAKLALYRDGYAPHAGLASAWPAIAAGVLALGAALGLRRRWPLLALGIGWFLAGHAMEAGPFSLELYFEHRNYLPSLGLAIGLAALLFRAMPDSRALLLLAALATAAGALAAWRAWHWADIDRLLAAEAPPAGEMSRRRQIDLAIQAVARGDGPARQAALDDLARGNAGDRAAAALWQAIFECDVDARVAASRIDTLRATPAPVLTHNQVSALELFARRAAGGRCAGLDRATARAVVDAWEAAARQPLSAHARWRLPKLRQSLEES